MTTITLNTLSGSELPNEGIQDALQTVLTGGTYVTIVYNDGSNTYTFDLSTEALMDYLGANFLTAGAGISLTYSDVGNTLTIAATGSGGMTNPMTTADDIIVGGASGTPARLAKGANATVLTINGSGNVAWAAPTGGLTNPMTTVNDLIIGGASGAPARLAKGSDSQVLTVDPTTHNLVWATPSGGGGGALTINNDGTPLTTDATSIDFVGFGVQASGTGASKTVRVGAPAVVPWASGRWYDWGSSFSWTAAASSVAVAQNTLYANPFYCPIPITGTTVSIDTVAINIGTGVAGNARIGLYEFTDVLTPGALIKDCGTVSTAGTGVVTIDISGAPAVLTGGKWYYTSIVFDAAPSVFMYNNTMVNYAAGRTAISSTTKWAGVSRAFTYAALPDPFGGTPSSTSLAIQVGMRVA